MSSDILQHLTHSTCEATLNNHSTAAELGSVALLLQKASATVR